MRLYSPPFTCGQCNRAVYLWCIYCDRCIQCLVGVECLARRFKDRDEVKWVLQKWEKEVQAKTISHPTPSMNVDGSSACVAKASSTPMDPVPPSSIPPGIVGATPSSDHPTSHTGCPSAEEILANVRKALSDSQGSFCPSLPEVEALLSNNWGQPLHVTVPVPSPQRFEFEACHSGTSPPRAMSQLVFGLWCITWWATQTALNVDWDTMGVAWVVRDSLWNASCATPQRRQHLVGSWVGRTLEAPSIH